MAPLPRRRLAPCRALSLLVGLLAASFAFSSLQPGSSFMVIMASATTSSGQDQVCTSLLDVMLVVDESGSIGTSNFRKVRQFIEDFVNSMPISPEDVRVGLITFATRSKVRWNLSDPKATNPSLAISAARSLSYSTGVTYTHYGLQDAKKLLYDTNAGARNNVPKLVLVMTDGASNLPSQTRSSAAALRDAGAIVVVLGVGSGVNSSECRSIAGCSTSNCPRYLQSNWSNVTQQVNGIIKAACKDLAKDAVCSEWSEYGPCVGECGKEGVQTSTRVEISPQKPGSPPCPTCEAPRGRSCAEQPPGLTRTQPCTMPVCKTDAHCGEFGAWSEWSTTCGTATRKRQREGYNSPPAAGGGLSCMEQNPPKHEFEVETVQKSPCPVQQQPGPWSEWTECSATCGGGTKHREREGLPQEGELYGGQTLEQQGIAVRETASCSENPCPIDATCGEWTEYSACSRTCGGGTQERKREPWLDNAQHGGRTCMEQYPDGPISVRECNTQPCPVDEVVGDWEDWGQCSEQCGGGKRTRNRGPSKQEAMFGGKTVAQQNAELPEGEKIEVVQEEGCNEVPCGPCTLPFSEWTECESCSGHRTRESAVAFDYTDRMCSGDTHEVQSCEEYCSQNAGGGAGGDGGAGGGTGGSGEEEGKEESSGFPTAAVAGGVAGGVLAIAAGAGAFYGLSGGSAAAATEAGAEVMTEAGTSNAAEVEKESLISAGEQSEMWAS
ncbi:microneme protein 2, putative [Eimeria tenella]|uniref:Microneme protein 2, putative n=1 Tax=Eimeria tenella TaxID=5802 RepID=U6KQ25_EIMTE|nr:microneme protein 2, putative [Eimeria tenella]CDJ38362.1 microneme protein 2, putative [Eimeria tenella]|eukprot:XP_013229200.1 microneme protein 2, putative [Eimeria tenella]